MSGGNRGTFRYAGPQQPGAFPWHATILSHGLLADRPTAGNALLGFYYFASDEDGGTLYQIQLVEGVAGWVQIAGSVSGGSSEPTDGDKGDITVSSTGTVWTIDAGVVSNAKFRDSAALSLVGRAANSTGSVADISATNGSGGGTLVFQDFLNELAWVQSASPTIFYNSGSLCSWVSFTLVMDGFLGSTQGQIVYRNDTVWTVLSPGTDGQFLKTQGAAANPVWAAAPATVADGDYGDITVSSSGTVWNIDAGVVTATELASDAVTTAKILDANVTTAKLADATLVALAGYNTNGILTQTSADNFTGRTITGTSNRLSVSNGDGVSGNPTLDIDAAYVGQTSITTLGTVTTGTWSATAIGLTKGGHGQPTAYQGLDALTVQGADIASATTTDLSAATGESVTITGTTTITGFGTAAAGVIRFIRFSGALTLTHNATSLILPGAANISTGAGDTATVVSLGSGNWRCWNYTRAGKAPFNASAAAQADMETPVDIAKYVTPPVMIYHPGIVKAWCQWATSGGVQASEATLNCTFTDDGTGLQTIQWEPDFNVSGTTYGWWSWYDSSLAGHGNVVGPANQTAKSGASISTRTNDGAGAAADPAVAFIAAVGDY